MYLETIKPKRSKRTATRLLYFLYLLDIKMEIELKSRSFTRHIALLVHERKTELNNFQHVNITFETLVLIVGRLEITTYSSDHARKFRVLFILNILIFLNDLFCKNEGHYSPLQQMDTFV